MKVHRESWYFLAVIASRGCAALALGQQNKPNNSVVASPGHAGSNGEGANLHRQAAPQRTCAVNTFGHVSKLLTASIPNL